MAQNNKNVFPHNSRGQKFKSSIIGTKSKCWQGCTPLETQGESVFFFLPLVVSSGCWQFVMCHATRISASVSHQPNHAETNTSKAPGQREGTERKIEGIYSVMGLVRALHYFSECPWRVRYKPCTEVAGLIAFPLLRRSVFLFSLPHSPTGIFWTSK